MKNYVDKDKLQEYTTKLTAKNKTIFATKAEVGSPLVASTLAEMTDQNRVYVYVGSESGYTAGNWYYYNGSAWTSGGVYNSAAVQTDTTLSIPGMAADAKVVGDALENVEIEVDATLTQAGMAADAKATGDAINKISETVNLFYVNDATVSNCTITNNADGTFTVSGTAGSSGVDFEGFTLPAGTYYLTTETISGTGGSFGLRYRVTGQSGSTAWNVNNRTQTFTEDTYIFARAGSGTYTDLIKRISIVEVGAEITAVDRIARNKINSVETQFAEIETQFGTLDDRIDNLEEVQNQIIEKANLFSVTAGTVKGCTLTYNSDGSITLTDTASSSADFEGVTLPAGTYTLKRVNISGSTTASAVAIRYGTESTTVWANNTEVTFESDTYVFLRAGAGTYTDYKLSVEITGSGQEYTAKDDVARNKAQAFASRLDTDEAAITALNAYKLPGNLLSKYNVFTCVDKTAVKMDENTVLIAYGDSITYGAENENNKSWVNYLQEKFGFTLYKKAQTGATYGHVRDESYWISTQLANTTDAQFTAATLIVFAAGTNDAGYDTEYNDLKTYVQAAIDYVRTKNANVPILFITPIKRGGTGESAARDKIPYMSGIIENVALVNGCSVICGWDFPIPSVSEGVIDGLMGTGHIHPGPLGQQIYARSVLNAIL